MGRTGNISPSLTRKPARTRITIEERNRLFNLYVRPNMPTIRSLTDYYTDRRQDVTSNFNYVITQMWKYIGSYKPHMSLNTWIHIVTKRYCFHLNRQRANENKMLDGIEFRPDGELRRGGGCYEISPFMLADDLSDTTYNALLKVPTEELSAFLLQLQGYSIKEIAEIEYNRGHLPRQSEEMVKKRLSHCREELKKYLRIHGITRNNYTSRKGRKAFDNIG